MGRQRNAEMLAHPSGNILDEELLVPANRLWVDAEDVLLEPPVVIRHSMNTDDHRGPHLRRLKGTARL